MSYRIPPETETLAELAACSADAAALAAELAAFVAKLPELIFEASAAIADAAAFEPSANVPTIHLHRRTHIVLDWAHHIFAPVLD